MPVKESYTIPVGRYHFTILCQISVPGIEGNGELPVVSKANIEQCAGMPYLVLDSIILIVHMSVICRVHSWCGL